MIKTASRVLSLSLSLPLSVSLSLLFGSVLFLVLVTPRAIIPHPFLEPLAERIALVQSHVCEGLAA